MTCAALLKALRDPNLTRTDLAVLGILLETETPARRSEIAKAAGCAPSSVPRSARKLEALGYVERIIDARDHGGRAKPTGYRLKVDTYQDGHVAEPVRIQPEPLEVVATTPKRPLNAPPRIQPDTSQSPPMIYNSTPQESHPEPLEGVVGGQVAFAFPAQPPSQPKPSKRGSRIRPDWRPHDPKTLELAREFGIINGWGEATLANFIDYWLGVSGDKGIKLDWEATYRNNLREEVKRRRHYPYNETSHEESPRHSVADPGVRRRKRSLLTERAMRAIAGGDESDFVGRVDPIPCK